MEIAPPPAHKMLTDGVLDGADYAPQQQQQRESSRRRRRRRRSRRPSPEPPAAAPWSPLAWIASPPWADAGNGAASAREVDTAYAEAARLALHSDDDDDGYGARKAQQQPRSTRSARSRGRSGTRESDRDEFAAARLARAEQARVPAHYETCQMQ
jgi:hypothetical protein